MSRPGVLALVRHGESAWIAEGRFQGQGDPPLSDTGLRQAAAVAQRLAAPSSAPSLPLPGGAPLAIWHSPLKRAAQTAGAIHEARGADAPLHPLDALAELAQGEWEGLTHEEVRSRWPRELVAWRDDPLNNHAPGGESLGEAFERARTAQALVLGSGDDVTDQPEPAEPVLGYRNSDGASDEPGWSIVVAHDGILRMLMLSMLEVPIERFWSFPLALASVSVMDLTAGMVQLRAHNLDEHIVALDRA